MKNIKGEEIKILESVFPLLGKISIPYKRVTLIATPFKRKEDLGQITKNDIKNIIQQNNYANQYLETIRYQLDKSKDVIQCHK